MTTGGRGFSDLGGGAEEAWACYLLCSASPVGSAMSKMWLRIPMARWTQARSSGDNPSMPLTILLRGGSGALEMRFRPDLVSCSSFIQLSGEASLSKARPRSSSRSTMPLTVLG